MHLTKEHEFQELIRRCDLAMRAPTARRALEIMGDYLGVEISELPEPLRTRYSHVLRTLAERSVTGP